MTGALVLTCVVKVYWAQGKEVECRGTLKTDRTYRYSIGISPEVFNQLTDLEIVTIENEVKGKLWPVVMSNFQQS